MGNFVEIDLRAIGPATWKKEIMQLRAARVCWRLSWNSERFSKLNVFMLRIKYNFYFTIQFKNKKSFSI